MASVFISKPHHKQEHRWSCLPACSKMLLDFHGNILDEDVLRELLGTDENGTSALNVLMLNASLANTKAELHHWLLMNLKEYLETKRQPCIVGVGTRHLPHWNGKKNLHAVVVHGFDDEHIFINDPYFKKKEFRIPIELFLLAWSETGKISITIERR